MAVKSEDNKKDTSVQTVFPGISTFALHMTAMLFMLCDHVWAMLVPGSMWLTRVGRLAFPIFAFLLAEGFCYTHSRKRYAWRLLLWALVSEIPFDLMYSGGIIDPFHQNVMWTLLLGFFCLCAIEKVKEQGKLWLTVAAVVAVSFAGWLAGTVLLVDYFGAGVLTVILFFVFRGRKWWQMVGQAAGLFWINCVLIAGRMIPVTLFGHVFEFPQQGFALLSLVFLWLYRGRQGFHNRPVQIACYAFYPVHMLALVLLAGGW